MSEEELLLEIDSFVAAFSELKVVKKYKVYKEAVKNDERLNSLIEDRAKLQKDLKYLQNEKKDECIKLCKELQIEHDNDPLYVAYQSYHKMVMDLLLPLREENF